MASIHSSSNVFQGSKLAVLGSPQKNAQSEANFIPIQKPSSWQTSLPRDILASFSPYLKPTELGRAITVCKHWKGLINNSVWSKRLVHLNFLNIPAQLKEALFEHRSKSVDNGAFDISLIRLICEYAGYSNCEISNAKEQFINPTPAIAFGRQEYIDFGLGDPGAVPLPANIHEILQAPCPWKGKTKEENHALVLVFPEAINGLDRLVKNSHKNNKVGIGTFWPTAQKKHGNTKVKKPYWVLMTKGVIPGSTNKNYAEQKALVEGKGYEVPRAYEVVTVLLTEYLRSGKRLLSECVFTRCKEKVPAWQWPGWESLPRWNWRGWKVGVGYFVKGGLCIGGTVDTFRGSTVGITAIQRL